MRAVTETYVFARNEDDVLLLRRRRAASGQGRLDLPGGKLKAGEDVLESASRALRQQTGLLLGRSALYPVFSSAIPDDEHGISVTRHYMLARVVSRALNVGGEHDSAVWIPEQSLTTTLDLVPHLAAYWYIERHELWQSHDEYVQESLPVES